MKLGWMSPPTSGYGYGYNPDPYGGYGNATMDSPTKSYFGGVVGYTSGTVVFTTLWTPVVDSPAPSVSNMGGGQVGVFSSDPVSYGVLVISATVDGVPCENKLRIAFGDAYGYYGNAAWDTTAGTPPPPAEVKLAWRNPATSDWASLDPESSGTMAPWLSYSPLYADMIGYSSGTVVWSEVWTPVTGGPAPDVYHESSSATRVSPSNFPGWGTLVISATVNGVPCTGSLRVVIAGGGNEPGSLYGAVAWDSISPPPSLGDFWTATVYCTETSE